MKTRSQGKVSGDKSVAVISNSKAMTKTRRVSRSPNPNPNPNPTAKKPKKPPTAFFYYLEDFRKTYQAENPDVKSMRDIGKACGEKWKTMTFEEKVHYYDIATEKRAEYEKAIAAYIKRKESGELSEESDEYE